MKIENSYFYIVCAHIYQIVIANESLQFQLVEVDASALAQEVSYMQNQLLLALIFPHHDTPAEISHLRLLRTREWQQS